MTTKQQPAATAAATITEEDKIFHFDKVAYDKLCETRPWNSDPNFFKRAKVSPTALIKMINHTISGGDIEVMGLLQGRFEQSTFIVMDSFPLPVEGTETRVNAGNEANEFMINYLQLIEQAGRIENCIGWYHSHPGYGCWLSGIDVQTQMLYQKYQEPWLAVVVDPKRTMSSGKPEIGAFRTYPEGYVAPDDDGQGGYQSIPLEKIEDFGVHCKQYYPLDISFFKSSLDSKYLDLLWNKYWVNTLSSSPTITNKDYLNKQLGDLASKLEKAENIIGHRSGAGFGLYRGGGGAGGGGGGGGGAGIGSSSGERGSSSISSSSSERGEKKKEESALSKLSKDSTKSAMEQVNGTMALVLKDMLFNPF
jgi:COP9 signalosome complex subunit 5